MWCTLVHPSGKYSAQVKRVSLPIQVVHPLTEQAIGLSYCAAGLLSYCMCMLAASVLEADSLDLAPQIHTIFVGGNGTSLLNFQQFDLHIFISKVPGQSVAIMPGEFLPKIPQVSELTRPGCQKSAPDRGRKLVVVLVTPSDP